MKEYNRKTKKWEEATDIKLKKRSTCKGGREHDWVHILPYMVEALPHYCGDAEKYYDIQKEIADFTDLKEKELRDVYGIDTKRFAWRPKESRVYICSVCGKKDYKITD